ncbi:MAG: flagellin lysine-N-methylase, partial [Clostridium sp.]
MKIRVPKYFNEFKCIADKCEDTCCAGWEVVIDEDAYEAYQQVKGAFGDRLRSEIVNDGEDNIFALKNNNCPFLNGSKLCDIYSELGEDYLCYTCQQFPRYTEEFGNLREVGISLSCPEAARIILGSSENVEFEVTENDEFILSDNEIDGRLYMELMQCRQIVFKLLQNRDIELKARVVLALAFIEEVQEKIDNDELGDIRLIKERYLD